MHHGQGGGAVAGAAGSGTSGGGGGTGGGNAAMYTGGAPPTCPKLPVFLQVIFTLVVCVMLYMLGMSTIMTVPRNNIYALAYMSSSYFTSNTLIVPLQAIVLASQQPQHNFTTISDESTKQVFNLDCNIVPGGRRELVTATPIMTVAELRRSLVDNPDGYFYQRNKSINYCAVINLSAIHLTTTTPPQLSPPIHCT